MQTKKNNEQRAADTITTVKCKLKVFHFNQKINYKPIHQEFGRREWPAHLPAVPH